jgi:hypothetical protein
MAWFDKTGNEGTGNNTNQGQAATTVCPAKNKLVLRSFIGLSRYETIPYMYETIPYMYETIPYMYETILYMYKTI